MDNIRIRYEAQDLEILDRKRWVMIAVLLALGALNLFAWIHVS